LWEHFPRSVINLGSLQKVENLTVTVLLESMAATFLLGLFLLPPGYLLGWASNLFNFREASGSERLLFSVACSVAVTPIFAVLLGRYLGVRITLAVFLITAAVSVGLLMREWRTRAHTKCEPMDRSTKVALCLMVAWSLLSLLSVVDWQIDHRLYVSAIIFDHSVRVPFVDSVIRNGVPPLNPFFGLRAAPVLRYYYYWYVVAALPGELAGLSPRACLNGSILWCGFALSALVPLFLKHFLREQSELRRKSIIGILLLLVTGLDVIPYTVLCLRTHVVLADMEWWDPNQVTSWVASLLWVPHHVAALLACMTGLLVLSKQEDNTLRRRLWMAALAGSAFASGAGLSLYVTFTFAVFCALWIILLAAQRRMQDFFTWLAASVLAAVLSAPFLHDLLAGKSAAGSRFAIFALRDFPLGIALLRTLGIHNTTMLDFANIPIIVLVYFLEFGLFFCVTLLQFKREMLGASSLGPLQKCGWLLFGSCLFVVTIFKSDTTGSNDLGFRGILPVQFVLLLWAAPMVSDLFGKASTRRRMTGFWREALYATLFIGVLSTLLQLTLLRGFAMFVDARRLAPLEGYLQMPDVGKRTYFLQQGFSELGRRVAKNDVYQFDTSSPTAWLIRLYAGHPFAAGDESCGTTFGGDPARCAEAMPYLEAPFHAAVTPGEVDRICGQSGVHILITTDVDEVWQHAESWVWQRKPIVANEVMRAFRCGAASQESAPWRDQ
jgi:hypothetical protein